MTATAPRIDDQLTDNTGWRAMKTPAEKKELWQRFHLQASHGFVGLPNRLVDSKAFAALTTGASVQTLIWFWQMVEYPRGKKKQAEPVIGRIDKITNNGELSFTYQEAGWRGMKQGRFCRALKELFHLGFIDIKRHGRGVQGEYTKYAISTRWTKYATDQWKEIPYPENLREGFRSDEFKAKRRKQRLKVSVQKRTLPTFKNGRYRGAKSPHNVQKCTLQTANFGDRQRSIMDVSIDLAMPIDSICRGSKVQRSGNKVKSIFGPFHNNDIPTFWAEDEPMVATFGSAVSH